MNEHLDLVEEFLRHPDIDVQTTIIRINHYPLGFLIEEAEKLADEYDSEEIEESIDQIPNLSNDDNAIVFQGTLLHHAVLHGSFELFKTLYPHFVGEKNSNLVIHMSITNPEIQIYQFSSHFFEGLQIVLFVELKINENINMF